MTESKSIYINLPVEQIKKMFYNQFLEKQFNDIDMYFQVKRVRKKALYESIKNDLSDNDICNDYKFFCKLLSNNLKTTISKRVQLVIYLKKHLPVDTWYAEFTAKQTKIETKMAVLLEQLSKQTPETRKKYTTEDAIFHEMINFK